MNEPFFYNDNFYINAEDLLEELLDDIDGEDGTDLPEDFEVKVELVVCEPVFKLNSRVLHDLLVDCFEDRINWDDDNFTKKLISALEDSIDFDMLEANLPSYYYPTGKMKTLTKEDFL